MKTSQQRKGELFIILGVFLWSLFPIFIQASYYNITPFTSLWISSLFAAVFFGILLAVRHRWRELLEKQAIIYTLYSTLFTGVIYYLLYFTSLRYSSAGNISILALSEAFFSFLLFQVWHKEYIPKEHIYGAVLILCGAIIVLAPSLTVFKLGDVLIILGAAIVPFGNFFVKKARKIVNTETLMFIRTMAGSLIIFIFSFVFHATSPLPNIIDSLPYLIVNGFLILGLSTNLWVEGIHRIPVTKANALNALGPLLTLFFAWIAFKTPPTQWQLLSIVPMFFGIVLISKQTGKTKLEA